MGLHSLQKEIYPAELFTSIWSQNGDDSSAGITEYSITYSSNHE
jgi:hypothetical protein